VEKPSYSRTANAGVQDLKQAQLRVGIIGATLTVNWLTHSDLAVAGTPTGVVVSSL
jgi:hypothetical protein